MPEEISEVLEKICDIQLAENEFVEQVDPNSDEGKRVLLKRTKIVKQTWSIVEIYQKIRNKKLVLNPEYQRNVVWKIDKQTAFIESLFMGIIIPPIYVVEIPGKDFLEENTYEVVDGKQRLSTIEAFVTNKIRLKEKSLEYYADWFANRTFEEIRSDTEFEELANEMLSSVLDIYVITANSPEFTKYDIFSRLNKGSAPLRVNEIRKAIYQSDVLKQVNNFVEYYVRENPISAGKPIVSEPYGAVFSENDIIRYEDYGRLFRSIAFFERANPESGCIEKYNSRPREMINSVLAAYQDRTATIDSERLKSIMEQTIQLMLLFKEDKFCQHLVDATIYYAVMYPEKFKACQESIASDDVIQETMKQSPSTTSNVNCRFKRVGELVLGQ